MKKIMKKKNILERIVKKEQRKNWIKINIKDLSILIMLMNG